MGVRRVTSNESKFLQKRGPATLVFTTAAVEPAGSSAWPTWLAFHRAVVWPFHLSARLSALSQSDRGRIADIRDRRNGNQPGIAAPGLSTCTVMVLDCAAINGAVSGVCIVSNAQSSVAKTAEAINVIRDLFIDDLRL